jgi:nucleotide-binding universal stress UspA family protein
MISSSAIFAIGVVTALLLAVFLYETIHGVTHARAGAHTARPSVPQPAAGRPLRLLIAIDGSPCSDLALQSVVARPWPAGSRVEIVSVVHARPPFVPELTLTGLAAHVYDLAADRRDAPVRLERARQFVASTSALAVSGKILEGDPAKVIVEEAAAWPADLIVVGTHGYGGGQRVLLGSVSQLVALHSPCSVEIVRCPHDAFGARGVPSPGEIGQDLTARGNE